MRKPEKSQEEVVKRAPEKTPEKAPEMRNPPQKAQDTPEAHRPAPAPQQVQKAPEDVARNMLESGMVTVALLRIGNTVVTEDQLKKLLNLVGESR